jgi:hypothetical protein
LKRLFAILFISIVSFAFTCETVEYFFKSLDKTAMAWVDDFHCEENGPESEESTENTEKSEIFKFSEDLFESHPVSHLFAESKTLFELHNHFFCSGDYRQEIYCPPELA